MKTPLNDDTAIIRAMLREHWQLTVSNIHFIPFGESAYSYCVETDAHTSYYLKITDRQTNVGIKTAAYMEFSLPIQRFVAEYGLVQVTAPLPQLTVQGAYQASRGSLFFALYTFIDGETLANAYPMPPDLVRQIGQALAALHTIQLPAKLQQHPPQDSLTAPFDVHLRDDLASLETISSQDAPYLQRLYEIVWPRREEVRAFLAHSQEYEQKARQIQYAYRIQLRNLAQWLHNLLHEPLDEGQREHDLKMLGFHCLERFAGVERMVQELPASLL
jgi:spectinomycin phosphotransferase